MKFFGGVRGLCIAISVGALLAVPLAMPVAAATGPQCTKLSTKTVGSNLTATLTGCTPTAATGGKGSGTFKSQTGKKAGTIAITITWTGGKGKTTGSIKFTTAKTLGNCAKATQSSRITITGSVTGGTGTAVKTIKKGQKIAGSVCSPKKSGGSLTLEPKTVLKF